MANSSLVTKKTEKAYILGRACGAWDRDDEESNLRYSDGDDAVIPDTDDAMSSYVEFCGFHNELDCYPAFMMKKDEESELDQDMFWAWKHGFRVGYEEDDYAVRQDYQAQYEDF